MKRLSFLQLMVLLSLSTSVFASNLRSGIRDSLNNLNYENCRESADSVIHSLDNMSALEMKEELTEASHDAILSDLWSLKILTHERMRAFYRVGELDGDCAEGLRGVFRGLRTFEDYVEENYLKNHTGNITFPDNAFEPGNIHVRRHPDFLGFDMNKDLKSGDIILSRGNAYTSAAIASLGEYDTQFSHLSVVYKDDDGKFWTVEAHIEVGSFVRPLQDHIDDKNYRTMVFRFDDEKVAAKAAKYIFDKVKKASDTTGNILYDFGFNLDDPSQFFCSEVASNAYRYSTNDEVKLPMFRSRIQLRKPKFVKQLGISVESSFIPADLEVDPRFKIITEWRDANKTNDNLEKDAILQAMFKWSDELDYTLVQASSKDSLIYRNIAWPLRRVPFLKKYFVKKLPLNMSRKLIGYFGVLESLGKYFQEKLKTSDESIETERGIPLMKNEKYDFLENMRLEDLRARRHKIHKMFRPQK